MLKTLIIIFTLHGTTSRVADVIQKEVGGDIFNVTSLVDYSGAIGFLRGCYHQLFGVVPDLKEVPDVTDYDVVYVGAPVWAWKPAGPILKVLEKVDFQNKKVVPFLTFKRRLGGSFEKFEETARNATIVGRGAFQRAEWLNDDQLKEKVESWLKTLTVSENTSEKQTEL